MKTYITENSLHQLSVLSDLQKLQVLYYQFLVAIKNKDAHVFKLKQECETLIEESSTITNKNSFVEKFRELIDNMPSEEETSTYGSDSLPDQEQQDLPSGTPQQNEVMKYGSRAKKNIE